jgi:hypothetical protein
MCLVEKLELPVKSVILEIEGCESISKKEIFTISLKKKDKTTPKH